MKSLYETPWANTNLPVEEFGQVGIETNLLDMAAQGLTHFLGKTGEAFLLGGQEAIHHLAGNGHALDSVVPEFHWQRMAEYAAPPMDTPYIFPIDPAHEAMMHRIIVEASQN